MLLAHSSIEGVRRLCASTTSGGAGRQRAMTGARRGRRHPGPPVDSVRFALRREGITTEPIVEAIEEWICGSVMNLWNPVERDRCRTHEAGFEGGVQRPRDPGTKGHLGQDVHLGVRHDRSGQVRTPPVQLSGCDPLQPLIRSRSTGASLRRQQSLPSMISHAWSMASCHVEPKDSQADKGGSTQPIVGGCVSDRGPWATPLWARCLASIEIRSTQACTPSPPAR